MGRCSPEDHPSEGEYRFLALGRLITCGVDREGTLYCLGDGASDLPQFASPAIDIAAGRDHACAVLVNGTVACWGEANSGEMDVPTGVLNARRVDCSETHCCVLTEDNQVECWGASTSEILAVPGLNDSFNRGGRAACLCSLGSRYAAMLGEQRCGADLVPPARGRGDGGLWQRFSCALTKTKRFNVGECSGRG